MILMIHQGIRSTIKSAIMMFIVVCFLFLSVGEALSSADSQTNSTASAINAPDIQSNTIFGSSNYVPEKDHNRTDRLEKFINIDQYLRNTTNGTTTNSQANVFDASTNNSSQKDPLLVNAQSPNPFTSNTPSGLNPQIATLLRNNPRLQMLARQNPLIAQQIMRNPQLLRDPQVQRAIQSQLSPGQGQNLLGQLGQIGLLRALNPLGLPLGGGFNPMLNRGNNLNNNNNNNNNRFTNSNGRFSPNGERNTNFGLPRSNQPKPPVNQHQETLPGGYYGNNGNYNPASEDAEGGQEEGVDPNGGEEGAGETPVDPNGGQDYDANTGADGSGGGEEGGANGEQQNPAEDPDIQQLQNFGGPINDNFPEGLFPPGLLTREDMDEIRKQQEKQAKEAEERERQQQQQQQHGQDGQASPDYEDNGEGVTPEDGSGADGGVGTGADGENQHGVDEHAGQGAVENGVDDGSGGVEGQAGDGHQADVYPGQQQHGAITTQSPLAYHNAYQPIQPSVTQRPNIGKYQPSVDYANNGNLMGHQGAATPPMLKNSFNYQPGVQYDQPTPYQGHYQMTSTPATVVNQHLHHHQQPQYGPQSGYSPMFNSGPASPQQPYNNMQQQHHQQPYPHTPQSQFGGGGGVANFNRFAPQTPYNRLQQLRQQQQPQPWPQPAYGTNPTASGGQFNGPNSMYGSARPPIAVGPPGLRYNIGQPQQPLHNDNQNVPFSTPASAYRSNPLNDPRSVMNQP